MSAGALPSYVTRSSARMTSNMQGPYHSQWALHWRHNERDGVSNHRRLHCLLNCWFWHRLKKTSKLHGTGHCAVNLPVTGELIAQKVSNAKNVSIWWRHHEEFKHLPYLSIVKWWKGGFVCFLIKSEQHGLAIQECINRCGSINSSQSQSTSASWRDWRGLGQQGDVMKTGDAKYWTLSIMCRSLAVFIGI